MQQQTSKPANNNESDIELCQRIGLTNKEEFHNVLTQLLEQCNEDNIINNNNNHTESTNIQESNNINCVRTSTEFIYDDPLQQNNENHIINKECNFLDISCSNSNTTDINTQFYYNSNLPPNNNRYHHNMSNHYHQNGYNYDCFNNYNNYPVENFNYTYYENL